MSLPSSRVKTRTESVHAGSQPSRSRSCWPRHQRRTAMVTGSRGMSRTLSAFGVSPATSQPWRTSCQETCSTPSSRSMSGHDTPQASPLRSPLNTMRCRQGESRSEVTSSRKAPVCSGVHTMTLDGRGVSFQSLNWRTTLLRARSSSWEMARLYPAHQFSVRARVHTSAFGRLPDAKLTCFAGLLAMSSRLIAAEREDRRVARIRCRVAALVILCRLLKSTSSPRLARSRSSVSSSSASCIRSNMASIWLI